MSMYLFLKLIHVLLFAFWLGTDMGTYYSSKFVVDPKLTVGQRTTALNILLGCDLGPRIAMPLVTPTGLHMASIMGISKISDAGLIGIWAISILWLVLVLAAHFSKIEGTKKKLKNIDFWIRPILVVGIAAVAIYNLMNPTYLMAPFLNYKLLILCGLILCGLGIRQQLSKFTPAFVDLVTGNEKPETNDILKKRMDNCLPYVYGIWAGTIASAALGLHLIG
ncbi:hypothetical protein N9954_08780 [Maribacter sp.]|nr:hypothetical protein [Maribacter sp.]